MNIVHPELLNDSALQETFCARVFSLTWLPDSVLICDRMGSKYVHLLAIGAYVGLRAARDRVIL